MDNNLVFYEGNYEKADERFEAALAKMRMGFKKPPKLNSMERRILEFCHNTCNTLALSKPLILTNFCSSDIKILLI